MMIAAVFLATASDTSRPVEFKLGTSGPPQKASSMICAP
jgi:hypothetical protein